MKIHIITLHSIYNPGSALQACGLQKFLIKNGYECELIDYRPSYSTVGRNKIKGYLRKILFYRNEVKVKKKYEEFIKAEMQLSADTFKYMHELKTAYKYNDIFIAGSDQLWNSDYDCGKDPAYYLDFTNSKNKMSYATSVGKKNISTEEIKRISNSIEQFDTITVREKSTSETLTQILGRNVLWVCDPVFLLDRSDYEKNLKRPIVEKYAVIYLSPEGSLLDAIVENIKKNTGYKIILIGGNRTRCKCDLHIRDLGPYDFLSYIKYAEIVVSTSFHATAFSHIFHRKFGSLLPDKNSERIESLLALTNLGKHIIRNIDDITSIYEDIDYDIVDNAIKDFVSDSKNILLNAISRLENENMQ